jgi:hypothetical protein
MGRSAWDRLVGVVCDEMKKPANAPPRTVQACCAADLYLDVREELLRRRWSWCQAHVAALDAVAVFARACAAGSMSATMLLAAYPERPL